MVVELKLSLTLKNVAVVSVAKTIWSSSVIKPQVHDFMRLRDSYAEHLLDSVYNYYPRLSDHRFWEKIIDCVLEKINPFPLPHSLKKDLEKTLIFIGEKILYHHSFGEKKYYRTRFSDFSCSSKPVYSYGFSQSGVMLPARYLSHSERCSEDKRQRELYFEEALDLCWEDIVKDFQDEIIEKLQDERRKHNRRELNFKNRKDVVFNILCYWYFVHFHVFGGSEPVFILNDGDYIVPLDVISRGLSCLQSVWVKKYFAIKLQSLGVSIKAFLKPRDVIRTTLFDLRLRPFCAWQSEPFFDGLLEGHIFSLNFLIREGELNAVLEHMNDSIKLFLLVWPFQEIFHQLLDLCFKEQINLDYEFLLDFALFNVAIHDENRYKYLTVYKSLYFEALLKIWWMTPENTKLSYMVEKTEMLISKNLKFPSLEVMLNDDDRRKDKDELNELIAYKWRNILKGGKAHFFRQFVKEITPLLTNAEIMEFKKRLRTK